MALPPARKIKRELTRVGRQARGLHKSVFRYLTERPYYDHVTARQIRISDGEAARADKVAIYLLYPRHGILPSHLRALRWMLANGYAPLVISNLPITGPDRDTLRPLAWRMMERPNFGYDFGGYRDGVLHLGGALGGLERLVLLNDSSWFPLPGTEGWLRDAETLGPEFVGACSHWGISRVETRDFRTIEWRFDTSDRNFHYGSFALSVGPKILQDPGFYHFWKRYRLTNDKSRTVRRGETGLTRWVLRSGHSHGSTLDISGLDRDLAALSGSRLEELAHALILHEDKEGQRLKRKILSDPAPKNRETLIALILTSIARQGSSYALPAYMVPEKNFAFLKKTPLVSSEETGTAMMKFIGGLDGSAGDEIRLEAAHLLAARGMDRSDRAGREPAPHEAGIPTRSS